MSARESILAAVRATKLTSADRLQIALPDVRRATAAFRGSSGDMARRFVAAARVAEVAVVECERGALPALVRERFTNAGRVVSLVPEIGEMAERGGDPRQLANVDLFVCEAAFGVAENGAVWLTTSRLGERAALFLATDVLVILPRTAIVEDLQAAYERIELASEPFGIFVAGPSKTADIEQVLVLGAHGPRTMTVALVT